MNLKSSFTKRLTTAILLLAVLFTPVALATQTVNAGLFDSTIRETCRGAQGCDSDADTKLSATIRKIINIFTVIVGIVAVIMIIISGFRFITAGGDSNGITAARNTLIYAIVGLIVVSFAQIIVRFVLGRVS